jgi:hypothetical protein
VPVAIRRYRPLDRFLAGMLEERSRRLSGTVSMNTWALYGFESIIWAQRPEGLQRRKIDPRLRACE